MSLHFEDWRVVSICGYESDKRQGGASGTQCADPAKQISLSGSIEDWLEDWGRAFVAAVSGRAECPRISAGVQDGQAPHYNFTGPPAASDASSGGSGIYI